MARYNEILVGHLARYLQKFTGIKGAVPTPTLAPEITPVLDVFTGNENRYLAGWNIFANFQDIPANAGNASGVQLRNPSGSNVVAVILRWYFSSTSAGAKATLSNNRGGGAVVDLASSTPAPSMDARIVLSNATCICSGQAPAPVLNAPFGNVNFTVASQDYDFILPTTGQEIPLLPGDAYRITMNAVNQELKCGFIWRERFLEESERT